MPEQGPGGGVAGGPAANFATTQSGLTVNLTDTSTPAAGKSIRSVAITWGDGGTDTINGGGTVTHTYGSAGGYRILAIVTDSAGLTDQASTTVNVTAPTGGGTGGGGGGTGGGGSGTGGGTGGGSGGQTGGGAAGNGQYTITTQTQTIQQLTSGQVLDVELVGFQTIPHNAYAQVYVPLTDWQAGNSANYVNPVAAAIEQLLGLAYVTAASYAQNVDPSTNLLTGYEAFTVSYNPPGPPAAMTTIVQIPISQLAQGADGAPTAAINSAYAQLQQTAGL